jgi:transcriptional regulator with XRE-family HTH domain
MLRNMSQRELAAEVGVSQPRISRLETGGDPSFAVAQKIADVLAVDADVLFPEDGGEELRKRLEVTFGMRKKRKRSKR